MSEAPPKDVKCSILLEQERTLSQTLREKKLYDEQISLLSRNLTNRVKESKVLNKSRDDSIRESARLLRRARLLRVTVAEKQANLHQLKLDLERKRAAIAERKSKLELSRAEISQAEWFLTGERTESEIAALKELSGGLDDPSSLFQALRQRRHYLVKELCRLLPIESMGVGGTIVGANNEIIGSSKGSPTDPPQTLSSATQQQKSSNQTALSTLAASNKVLNNYSSSTGVPQAQRRSICGFELQPLEQLCRQDLRDREAVSTALGFLAHFILLLAKYTDVPLRAKLRHTGTSRSYVSTPWLAPPTLQAGMATTILASAVGTSSSRFDDDEFDPAQVTGSSSKSGNRTSTSVGGVVVPAALAGFFGGGYTSGNATITSLKDCFLVRAGVSPQEALLEERRREAGEREWREIMAGSAAKSANNSDVNHSSSSESTTSTRLLQLRPELDHYLYHAERLLAHPVLVHACPSADSTLFGGMNIDPWTRTQYSYSLPEESASDGNSILSNATGGLVTGTSSGADGGGNNYTNAATQASFGRWSANIGSTVKDALSSAIQTATGGGNNGSAEGAANATKLPKDPPVPPDLQLALFFRSDRKKFRQALHLVMGNLATMLHARGNCIANEGLISSDDNGLSDEQIAACSLSPMTGAGSSNFLENLLKLTNRELYG